ncbi:MAG TPA: tryptophan 2,3-dioxygenase family protein [Candidatus Nanopelagicales bacterium]|nr:tryptophan 2,3-dioxygenase family protein [Candidatus Nanopelagicales bacterium]
MAETHPAVTYASYLRVPELLALQHPRTGEDGRIAEHDELLFITIHQVYELWFQQLLHELRGDALQPGTGGVQGALAAGEPFAVLGLLGRVRTIIKTLVAQVDVLETMTPVEFSSFRSRLESASGFQSAQFRELEAVLGRRDARLVPEGVAHEPAWTAVSAAARRASVWSSYVEFLAARGHAVPDAVRQADPSEPVPTSEEMVDVVVAVYRTDEAAMLVAERMLDVDEGLQEWRYRHLKMVERTIGAKQGTGGSSGAAYLATTLFRPVFPDLWTARSRL